METPLQKLQIKIGVKPDNSFGPSTLKAIKEYYKLSDERAAHFCGQVAHETGGFNIFTENLNYSATGLLNKFKKYFPGNLSDLYARQPHKIGSRIYANRMGNGNEASQEGYFFRGRGGLQTTGKANYKSFSEYIGDQKIMVNPDLVATNYAFEAAIYFFKENSLWTICDRGVTDATILSLTKRINGGTNGLDERVSLTKRYYSWLKNK
jgi:putative chitinase